MKQTICTLFFRSSAFFLAFFIDGSDYTPLNGRSITIRGGERRVCITVSINDDLVVEGNETFTMTLEAPAGGLPSGIGIDNYRNGTFLIIIDNDSKNTLIKIASLILSLSRACKLQFIPEVHPSRSVPSLCHMHILSLFILEDCPWYRYCCTTGIMSIRKGSHKNSESNSTRTRMHCEDRKTTELQDSLLLLQILNTNSRFPLWYAR